MTHTAKASKINYAADQPSAKKCLGQNLRLIVKNISEKLTKTDYIQSECNVHKVFQT